MAERLIGHRISSLSPSRCFRFLDRDLYSTLSLFTSVSKLNVYRRHTAGGGGGNPVTDQHPVLGAVAVLLSLLHAKESGISSGRLGFWLV